MSTQGYEIAADDAEATKEADEAERWKVWKKTKEGLEKRVLSAKWEYTYLWCISGTQKVGQPESRS